MASQQLSDEEITRKLHLHPHIRERIISILSVVEADGLGLKRADDVEERLVEEVRRMGQEAMQVWVLSQIG